MNVKKRLFAAALVIGLAAAGVLISGSHNVAKAGPGATQVSIMSPLPLPITGTATVSGTVGATQSGAWNVNVANSPTVSLAGTPTVNANVTFPASQGVTVTAAGPLTNVGRLPSQQVTVVFQPGPVIPSCPLKLYNVGPDDSFSCFDMANQPGQVFIVTDLSWNNTGAAGVTCDGSMAVGSGIFPLWISSAVVGSDGLASKTEHFTTGVKMTLNPRPDPTSNSLSCGTPLVVMNGYFLPNQ